MTWHRHVTASNDSGRPADIWRDGAFVADDVSILADDAAPPASGRVLVSLGRWTAERAALLAAPCAVGVIVRAGEDIALLAGDAASLGLIALDFPKYGDGRAYSYAVLLRTRYGFTGELRAYGDVLIDQIAAMQRVGFSSFEVRNPHTRAALDAKLDIEVKTYYQPAVRTEVPAGTRPWHRRG